MEEDICLWDPGKKSFSTVNHKETTKLIKGFMEIEANLQEHQSSSVGLMCAVCELSYGPWIKSLVTTSCKLLAACFCSLGFACKAFCAYKLNSNYTTGWQSTEFVHLREPWHFSMPVNTYAWVWTGVCKSSFVNEEISVLLILELFFKIHEKKQHFCLM